MKPVFILSTGRAGTTFVARMLSSQTGVDVSHQRPGSRALNILGNLVITGRVPVATALASGRWLGLDSSSTADPLRALLLTAAIRAGKFRDARVIHVVRDPRTFVSSFMSWKAASVKRTFLHHVVPAWQPNPWLAGECSLARWAGMSKFEHFCWVWRYKNQMFGSLSELADYRWYRFEDIADGRRDVINDLGGFLGAELQPSAVGRVNASSGSFPAWEDWNGERASVLHAHCGTLMSEYGYGDEDAWLYMTGASVAKTPARRG